MILETKYKLIFKIKIMKKITSSIFVALLIAGASSVKAQDVKKENKPTNATSKTLNKDLTKKTDAVKVMDATDVNPDGTLKEVKTVKANDKPAPKTKNVNKAAVKNEKTDVVIEKNGTRDKAIKKD